MCKKQTEAATSEINHDVLSHSSSWFLVLGSWLLVIILQTAPLSGANIGV